MNTKCYFIIGLLLLVEVLLVAEPVAQKSNTTQAGVEVFRPITSDQGAVTRRVTAVGNVSRPKTTVNVSKPVTPVMDVERPITDVGTLSRPSTSISVTHPTTQSENAASNVGGNTSVPTQSVEKAGVQSASTSVSSGGIGKAPGTGSFSSFEAKDLKASPIAQNVGGLSQTREDAPSNALLDSARNKVDLSGNLNAIAPQTKISESALSEHVTNAVGNNGQKGKK